MRANTYSGRVDDSSESQRETAEDQVKDGVAQELRHMIGPWCGGHDHSGLNRDPGVTYILPFWICRHGWIWLLLGKWSLRANWSSERLEGIGVGIGPRLSHPGISWWILLFWVTEWVVHSSDCWSLIVHFFSCSRDLFGFVLLADVSAVSLALSWTLSSDGDVEIYRTVMGGGSCKDKMKQLAHAWYPPEFSLIIASSYLKMMRVFLN